MRRLSLRMRTATWASLVQLFLFLGLVILVPKYLSLTKPDDHQRAQILVQIASSLSDINKDRPEVLPKREGSDKVFTNATGVSSSAKVPVIKKFAKSRHGRSENASSIKSGGMSRASPVVKRILYWTWYWDRKDYYMGFGRQTFLDHCEVSACEATADRSLLTGSDAVLIHINNVTSLADLPQRHLANQTWVFFNMEPPHLVRTNLKEFNGVFNISMTYRLDSDIPKPYGKLMPLTPKEAETAARGPARNFAEKRRSLVAWLVSNCDAPSNRMWYAHALQQHCQVHIYGECGDMKCDDCYGLIQKEYKFYLAFENSLCRDYASEKVWRALEWNLVPIVLGSAHYVNLLPPHSFIDVRSFHSPAALAGYLEVLHRNDTLYNEYFAWKKKFRVWYPYSLHNGICDLCKYLHHHQGAPRVIQNLAGWYGEEQSCMHHWSYYKPIEGYPG